MPGPTIQDVLDAIAALDTKVETMWMTMSSQHSQMMTEHATIDSVVDEINSKLPEAITG
jgi:hypothetical protein